MPRTPIIAGIAAGAVLGLGGVLAAELVTEGAEAQSGSQFATKSDLQATNARASAAINMGKRVWNLLGIYVAEPNELVGAKSGPISQQRGVGGGIPTTLLQGQGGSGAAGPQGPRGEQGPAGPQGSAAAFATVAADGAVDPSRSALAGGRVVKAQGAASVGFYCLYDLPFTPKSAVASANIDPSRSSPPPNPPFRAGAMTYVTRDGETPPISGCVLEGLQVIVSTYAAQGTNIGDSVDYPFSVWIED